MKKTTFNFKLTTSMAVICVVGLIMTSATVYRPDIKKAETTTYNIDKTEVLKPITPSIKEATKLNFIQRVMLKLIEKSLRKQINKVPLEITNKDKKQGKPFHWAAITGFICGIIAFFTLFLTIPGIVFSAIGLAKTGSNKEKGGLGLAITGFVCSLLAFLVILVLIA